MADIYFKKTAWTGGDYWKLVGVRNVAPAERAGLSLVCQEYLVVSGDIAASDLQQRDTLERFRQEMKKDGHTLHFDPPLQEAADPADIDSILVTLLEGDDVDEWIGVDLDGTLAKALPGAYKSAKIGDPVPAMVKRVRRWVGHGQKVKIFTARADDELAVNAIKKWLKKNDLPDLEVTNLKDQHMKVCYDDRAVAVKKNTGELKENDLEDMVICPVCNGTRESKYTGRPCRCCGETGVIPVEMAKIKARIAADLRRRLVDPSSSSSALAEAYDPPWSENWRPNHQILAWFRQFLNDALAHPERDKWVSPGAGLVYQYDLEQRIFYLIAGNPHDPKHWHDKNKVVLGMLGYNVVDTPPPADADQHQTLAEAMLSLYESPEIETLKKHQVKLTDTERAEVMKAKAVWHMGLGGKASPAVKKATVNGKAWYWCNTHRCGQVRPTLRGAIRAFHDVVKETA